MSLILYGATESEIRNNGLYFTNNGIGILADAIDAEVYEELNGQFELRMKYPVTGIHFAELQCDRYITAPPDPMREAQPFRIYRITKPLRGIVTVYARHWVYNLQKVVVMPFFALKPDMALGHLQIQYPVNPHPFLFWTNKTNGGLMIPGTPSSAWSLMGSGEGAILDVFGGEYEFDGLWVRLWDHRGEDRGVSVRYGKNLTDLQMDENIANVYTGVVPYWNGVNEVTGMTELVTLEEGAVRVEGDYTEDKLLPLDLSQVFSSPPTQAQLREQAQLYIQDNDIGKPEISWTVSFIPLEQTLEYRDLVELEQVLLGDTVTVYVEKLGVDASARVVATVYKPLMKRYKNVTLGKVKANMASSFAKQSQQVKSVSTASGQIDAGRVDGTLRSRDGLMWINLATGEINLGVSDGEDSGTTLGLRMKGNRLTGYVRDSEGSTEVFRIAADGSGVHITAGSMTLLGKKAAWTEDGSGNYTLTGTD